MPDISKTAIKEYIEHFPNKLREEIANVICDGEAFINAFEDAHGKVLMDVLSDQYISQIRQMLQLIREGKFDDEEELRRIRQHCIAVNQLFRLIRDWDAKLKQYGRHIEQIQ